MPEQTTDFNFNKIFEFIEKSTTNFIEKLVKDDNIIKIMGKWRDNALDFKNYFDKIITETLKNMNLPNKIDQEKTLHKINMLESEISELTEKIEKLIAEKNKTKTNQEKIDN